jgi:fructokinase
MKTLSGLAEVIDAVASTGRRGHRRLVALAGPPASGKTTLAADLAAALTAAGKESCVLPMDGFHLDNRILDARGLRARKGAPETFDVAGFATILSRAAGSGEVIHPVFDRTLDCAIAGAGLIPESCDTVVVEGNYLMLRAAIWQDLAGLWDISIALSPSLDVLRERLIRRWLVLGHGQEEAVRRTEDNDLVNAALIARESAPANYGFVI